MYFPKKLEAFLRHHRVLEQYKQCFDGTDGFFREEDESDWILEAFCWMDSPCGHHFWELLNDLWLDFPGYDEILTVIPVDFWNFLRSQEALDSYIKNFNVDEESPHEFFREDNRRSYVAGAFVWSSSEEGRSYWMNVDERWKREVS